MAEEQSKPQLPETPFNGLVVSVSQVEDSAWTGHSHICLAIASEHDSSVIVFHGFGVRLVDPRRHLRPGHKVRVKKVVLGSELKDGECRPSVTDMEFSTPIVCATVIDFDFKQLTRGFEFT